MKGLGTGVKANMLDKLFGKRSVLAGMVLSTSGERFKIFRDKLKDIDGEAQRVADTMQSGLGGALRRVKADLQNVAIKAGDALAPALIKVGKYLEDGLQKLTAWIPANRKMVVLIAASAAGLLVLAAALVVAGISLKLFGIALTLASMALGIFGVVKVVVITAIGIFMGLISTITGLWSAILFGVGLLSSIASAFVAFGSATLGVFTTVWGLAVGFFTFLATAPLWMIAAVTLAIATLPLLFQGFSSQIKTVTTFIGYMGAALRSAFSGIASMIGTIIDSIQNLAATFVSAFNMLKEALGVSLMLVAVGEFEDAWDIALMSLKVSFAELMQSLRQSFNSFTEGIIKGMMAAWSFLAKLDWQMMNPNATVAQRDAAFGQIDRSRQMMLRGRKAALAGEDFAEAEKIKSLRFQLGVMLDMGRVKAEDKESIIDKLMGEFLKRFPDIGAGDTPMVKPEQDIKPLEGLQRGTIEAAKAAYEASIGEDTASMNRQKIKALQQVAANTGLLVENLGIA